MDAQALANALKKGAKLYEVFREGAEAAELLAGAESRARECEALAVAAERRREAALADLRTITSDATAARDAHAAAAKTEKAALAASLAETHERAQTDLRLVRSQIDAAKAEHTALAEQVVKAKAAAAHETAELSLRITRLKDELAALKQRVERV